MKKKEMEKKYKMKKKGVGPFFFNNCRGTPFKKNKKTELKKTTRKGPLPFLLFCAGRGPLPIFFIQMGGPHLDEKKKD